MCSFHWLTLSFREKNRDKISSRELSKKKKQRRGTTDALERKIERLSLLSWALIYRFSSICVPSYSSVKNS